MPKLLYHLHIRPKRTMVEDLNCPTSNAICKEDSIHFPKKFSSRYNSHPEKLTIVEYNNPKVIHIHFDNGDSI